MDSSNATDAASANSSSNVLPLVPLLTPAFGVAGAILILSGLAYCVIGIRIKWMHVSLSCAYLTSLGVTALILEVMKTPITDTVQGLYLIAIVVSGAVIGGISVVYKPVSEGLGCFLGGFCIAMWMEMLRSGGLIQSSKLTILIVLVSLASYALSFFRLTKYPAFVITSAFTGATAVILGVDCYSRAGLKEFWVYTWRIRNDKIFPYQTSTYPLTRGIQAEIGCIAVIFFFGLVSQFSFYRVSNARKQKKAAEVARLNEDRERQESDIARQIQETTARDLGVWEATYAEKKKPEVDQKRVESDAATRRGHWKALNAVTRKLGWSRSDARTLVDSSVRSQHADGVATVEVPAITPETTGRTDGIIATRPSPQQSYPSLRPTSYPPRPTLPLLHDDQDSSSDGIDYVNVNFANSSLPFLPNRVSSLELPLGGEENGQDAALDSAEAQINSDPGLGQEITSTESQELQPKVFDFERIPDDIEGDRNSIQNSKAGEEDTDQCHQMSKLEPNTESQDCIKPPTKISKLAVLSRKREAMDRTQEWTETLGQADDPELSTEGGNSARVSCANDEMGSLWSGFEGAYTNTTDTSAELSFTKEQVESKDVRISEPPVPKIPQAGILKQEKRRSRHASGKAPILPKPVKSARVDERNSSLPALNTAPTLIEQREAVLAERERASYKQNSIGSAGHDAYEHRHKSKSVVNTDDMTLAQRRASLQAARTTSSGQVSTVSSNAPRSSGSMGVQSPVLTTAMTTPTTSSPSHPHFLMTAHPLRRSYPSPPGGNFSNASQQAHRLSNPVSPLSGPGSPVSFDKMPSSDTRRNGDRRKSFVPVTSEATTLVKQVELQEKRLAEQREEQRKAQHKAAAQTARDRRNVETRRRQMKVDEMMRQGKLDGVHQEAMRKMQRTATENAKKSGG